MNWKYHLLEKFNMRHTGIDLSKILGGQTQIFGENVVKTDKCMGVSRFFRVRARAAPPKVYVYDETFPNKTYYMSMED